MGEVLAFVRHDALTASSYRLQLLLSLFGLVFGVIPLYFVAQALQPMMADSIRGQGGQYFGFVVLGLAAQQFVYKTVNSLPRAFRTGLRTGTLEYMIATRSSLPTLILGMLSFPILWATVEAAMIVIAGMAIGADFTLAAAPGALLVVVLIIAAHVPFALAASALILAFRTSGPLTSIVGAGSMLLGGVYYPTQSIPGWIEHLSAIVPLTYGLRALRSIVSADMPMITVWSDVAILTGIAILFLAISAALFGRALNDARRAGTLGQY